MQFHRHVLGALVALAGMISPGLASAQVCGNGVIETGETCDDDNTESGDGCTGGCNKESGWVCVGEPSQCHLCVCGDGVKECIEECDNGTENSDTVPNACRTDCELPSCGDGVEDSGEECDEGHQNSDFMPNTCRSDCDLPWCGDGVIDVMFDEQCDLGTENSDAPGSQCTTLCLIPFCSNGVPEAGELCDDGNTSNNDGCTGLCRWNICGDGFVDQTLESGSPREVCDDGNNRDGDDCRYDCAQDFTLCGNTQLDPGEECDEGVANSDAPDATCRMDCSEQRCGDGVVDDQAGELCDGGPDCSPLCQLR